MPVLFDPDEPPHSFSMLEMHAVMDPKVPPIALKLLLIVAGHTNGDDGDTYMPTDHLARLLSFEGTVVTESVARQLAELLYGKGYLRVTIREGEHPAFRVLYDRPHVPPTQGAA